MAVAKKLSPQTSAQHVAQACQRHVPVELTVPIDNHRQLHGSRLAQLSADHLIVSTPDDLRQYRDLMWSLPVEGTFQLPVGWGYFRTTTDRNPMAVDSEHLALKRPDRLKFLLNPACLADSIVLKPPVDATFHTQHELTGAARNIPMTLEHLSSEAAVCVAAQALTYRIGQFGMFGFVLHDQGPHTKFLLRGTIEDTTEVGDGEALVVIRFEQASRHQAHRDNIDWVRHVVDTWWATTGQPEPPRETQSAGTVTITDAQVIRRTLAGPFGRHIVATAHAADQTTPIRLLEIDGGLLAIQAPAMVLGQPAAKPGQTIRIELPATQSTVAFEASVADHQPIELEGVGSLHAVILDAPTQCTMERRRSRFRTAVALCPPVYAIVQPQQAAPSASNKTQLANAALLNISVEGARFEAIHETRQAWDLTQTTVGQTLNATIYLYGEHNPLLVTVIVRNQSRNPSTGAVVIGVQFGDMDQTIEGRTAKRQIERFTAQTQRQQIHRNHTIAAPPVMAANA